MCRGVQTIIRQVCRALWAAGVPAINYGAGGAGGGMGKAVRPVLKFCHRKLHVEKTVIKTPFTRF
jgi:hypothetical protein